MRLVLLAVAGVAGFAAIQPIANALDTPIVGGAVPTRPTDLLSYVTLKKGDTIAGQSGPFVVDTDAESSGLRELAALSFGGGLAVGALAYAVLSRVLP